MRNLLSTCTVALAIVCATQFVHAEEPASAEQPAPAATPAPANESTPAESATPAAEPTAAAKQEEQEDDVNSPEFQRVAKAYRQIEKDGQKLYCRNEKRLGTRLGAPVCLTEAQLWERIHKAEDIRDDMRKGSGGPCGSSAAVC